MVTYLPSQATTQINVTALNVATNLSISAPASATQGDPFTIIGQLTRVDTGVALTGETIALSYNGQSIGSPTTDMNGAYSIQAIIPDTGTFTITADFAGSTRPGLTFLPSMGQTGVILDGITQYLPYIIPAAIIAWLLLSKK